MRTPVRLVLLALGAFALDIPHTFHNYGSIREPQAAPYDIQGETPAQNAEPSSISYVPVQPAKTLTAPAPMVQTFEAPKRSAPKPNGHVLAMQQAALQAQGIDTVAQEAKPSSSPEFVAPESAQNAIPSLSGNGPQGVISSGSVVSASEQNFNAADSAYELQRQQQAQADAQRARDALEAQRAKIMAKQRQMEAQRREQMEQYQSQFATPSQFEQYRPPQIRQHPVSHARSPPNPNQPSDQHAALSQLSNQQLEEYAQRLRDQLAQEQAKQTAQPTEYQTLPVQTMATTALPTTSPLTIAESTAEFSVVNQPQPLPPSPFVGVPSIPPKNTHDINYCDRGQYDDQQLADLHLRRMDYFIYNTSCSGVFFQCAIGQTFVLKCPSEEGQAFDPAISSCNFKNSVRFCPQYDHVMHSIRETCTPQEFACCALPQKCIDYSRRCDGHRDCSDGDDENNCPSCAKNEFVCVKSGICIPATQRCDGKPDDCGDGTNMDEIGCSKNETCWGKFVCDSVETVAEVGHSVCLDFEKHCDNVKDCPGGEDEMNCRVNEAKYLSCENQKQTVRREQWCDGREDCADGSDEKYCF